MKMHGLMILIVWCFFSHGASNSCGVPNIYHGKWSFVLNEQKTEKAGKILISGITPDADQYIIVYLL